MPLNNAGSHIAFTMVVYKTCVTIVVGQVEVQRQKTLHFATHHVSDGIFVPHAI